MAGRLTDWQKKQIMADRACEMSIRQLAKKYNVSTTTIERIVKDNAELQQLVAQKKEQNTADILAYMDSQRDAVCEIIDVGLKVLPEKIQNAKSASEVTTALGTLIDKWALKNNANGAGQKDTEDDPITQSLKEDAKNGLL